MIQPLRQRARQRSHQDSSQQFTTTCTFRSCRVYSLISLKRHTLARSGAINNDDVVYSGLVRHHAMDVPGHVAIAAHPVAARAARLAHERAPDRLQQYLVVDAGCFVERALDAAHRAGRTSRLPLPVARLTAAVSVDASHRLHQHLVAARHKRGDYKFCRSKAALAFSSQSR